MTLFRKITIFGLLGLFLITAPLLVFAGSDKTVYVGPDEIVDGNFIRMGSIIDINGPVNGDVVVAGENITINGPVAGDVIAIGQYIKITGEVEGSIRVVGSTIEIAGNVDKNIWTAGEVISIDQDVVVGWDVYAAGSSVSIKGRVDGSVKAVGQNVLLGNEIKKDSVIKVGSEGQLVLLPTAKILGDLKFKGSNQNQLSLNEGAEIIGVTNFEEYEKSGSKSHFLSFGLFKLVILFSLLILGLLLITFLPKYILQVDSVITSKPGASIGWGFIFLIATPVVSLILAITFVGLPLAILLLLVYIITFFVSFTFAGFSLGLYILNQFNKEKKYKGSLIWPLILGIVLIMILVSLPFIGWLIKIIAMVLAVGAMMRIKLEMVKNFR